MATFPRGSREAALIALMAVQALCVLFFAADMINDLATLPPGQGPGTHNAVEILANLGLLAAVVVEGVVLSRLVARQARTEKALSAASGALYDLMLEHFDSWGLTPAEADVATFTIKGFSIAEIAELRSAAEGTVKSQLNAIYRKSGLSGRGQLVSILIEDLLHGPLASRDSPGS